MSKMLIALEWFYKGVRVNLRAILMGGTAMFIIIDWNLLYTP